MTTKVTKKKLLVTSHYFSNQEYVLYVFIIKAVYTLIVTPQGNTGYFLVEFFFFSSSSPISSYGRLLQYNPRQYNNKNIIIHLFFDVVNVCFVNLILNFSKIATIVLIGLYQ